MKWFETHASSGLTHKILIDDLETMTGYFAILANPSREEIPVDQITPWLMPLMHSLKICNLGCTRSDDDTDTVDGYENLKGCRQPTGNTKNRAMRCEAMIVSIFSSIFDRLKQEGNTDKLTKFATTFTEDYLEVWHNADEWKSTPHAALGELCERTKPYYAGIKGMNLATQKTDIAIPELKVVFKKAEAVEDLYMYREQMWEKESPEVKVGEGLTMQELASRVKDIFPDFSSVESYVKKHYPQHAAAIVSSRAANTNTGIIP